MKKIYSLKIALLTLFIMMLCSESKSQIIYNDIVDTTISRSSSLVGTTTYVFDINNDAITDYNFGVRIQAIVDSTCGLNPSFQTILSAWCNTMPGYSNQVGDSAGYVAEVDSGTTIDSAAFAWSVAQNNWLCKHDFTINQCSWDSAVIGNWIPGTTGFVPVKFKIGAFIYFGWIRASLEMYVDSANNSNVKVTIYDYAYNSAPNQPIAAGETGVVGIGNVEKLNNLISLYPLPAGNFLTMNNKSNQSMQFTLFNLAGEVQKKIVLNPGISSINIEDLSSGIFYYTAEFETGISRGKLIVQ